MYEKWWEYMVCPEYDVQIVGWCGLGSDGEFSKELIFAYKPQWLSLNIKQQKASLWSLFTVRKGETHNPEGCSGWCLNIHVLLGLRLVTSSGPPAKHLHFCWGWISRWKQLHSPSCCPKPWQFSRETGWVSGCLILFHGSSGKLSLIILSSWNLSSPNLIHSSC